jgi:hypothetical protein
VLHQVHGNLECAVRRLLTNTTVVTIAAAAAAAANTLSNSEKLVANPDAWSLKLNAQGNLASTILDLFANDTGSILNANITPFGPPYCFAALA